MKIVFIVESLKSYNRTWYYLLSSATIPCKVLAIEIYELLKRTTAPPDSSQQWMLVAQAEYQSFLIIHLNEKKKKKVDNFFIQD